MNDLTETNPAICGGKPVVRGTRVIVSHLRAQWHRGASEQELLEDYPAINLETLRAILQCTG